MTPLPPRCARPRRSTTSRRSLSAGYKHLYDIFCALLTVFAGRKRRTATLKQTRLWMSKYCSNPRDITVTLLGQMVAMAPKIKNGIPIFRVTETCEGSDATIELRSVDCKYLTCHAVDLRKAMEHNVLTTPYSFKSIPSITDKDTKPRQRRINTEKRRQERLEKAKRKIKKAKNTIAQQLPPAQLKIPALVDKYLRDGKYKDDLRKKHSLKIAGRELAMRRQQLKWVPLRRLPKLIDALWKLYKGHKGTDLSVVLKGLSSNDGFKNTGRVTKDIHLLTEIAPDFCKWRQMTYTTALLLNKDNKRYAEDKVRAAIEAAKAKLYAQTQ